MNELYLPGKVYFKNGSLGVALRELTEICRLQRALVVTDSASYAGSAAGVLRMLEQLGMRAAEYFIRSSKGTLPVGDPASAPAGDPNLPAAGNAVSVEDLRGARPLLREFAPEVIVGVGDGRVMSAAKLLRLLAENPELDPADGDAVRTAAANRATRPDRGVRLVLVATAFADGAQNTPFAEMDDAGGGHVKVIRGFRLIPDMSVTDAQFVMDCPADQAGADAGQLLARAVNAWLDENCCAYTGGLLEEAIRGVLAGIRPAMAGSPAGLERLHNAASVAGNAFGNVYETYNPMLKPSLPKIGELSESALTRLAALARELGYDTAGDFLRAAAEVW